MRKIACVLISMVLSVSSLGGNVEKEYQESCEVVDFVFQDNTPMAVSCTLVPENERGFYEPTVAHDWTLGNMSFEGDTSTDTHLYTDKYFTDYEEGYLNVHAHSSYAGYPRYGVRVRIYQKGLLFDTLIDTQNVEAGDTLYLHLYNFNSSKKYYIKFEGTFHVTGFVSRTN